MNLDLALGTADFNNGLAGKAAVPLVNTFEKATLGSPADFARALAVVKGAFAHFMYQAGQDKPSKAAINAIASNMTKFVGDIARLVSLNPSVAGDVSGITVDNARAVVAEAIGILRGKGDRGTQSLLESDIGISALSATVVNMVNSIERNASVTGPSGLLTWSSVAAASGITAAYYPQSLLLHVNRIYDSYKELNNTSPMVEKMARIIGKAPVDLSQMNSYTGAYHAAALFLQDCEVTFKYAGYYRRDAVRSVKGSEGNIIESPTSVLVLTHATMRVILSACLEMSIKLGQVNRLVRANAKKDGGLPEVTYDVLKNSDFGNIIMLAKRSSALFNPAGPKDHAFYLATRPADERRVDIFSNEFFWKSVTITPEVYSIKSSSIVTEIEARLRISEYNNEEVVTSGPRPSGRQIPLPLFSAILKNPREFEEVCASVANASSFDNFVDTTKMRKELFRGIQGIYRGGQENFGVLRVELLDFREIMRKICSTRLMIYVTNQVGRSLEHVNPTDSKIKSIVRGSRRR
jgi:hypothetical protein